MGDHPDHQMHANSLAAYATLDIGDMERAIVDAFRKHGPMTDRQCAAALGVTRDKVQPRITELVDDLILVERSKIKCPETGKSVRVCEARL